jgi:mannose-6-phosphate isomerase
MGLLTARRVKKPWGHEEVFAENERYVGKILFVRQGEALSLQYHEYKDETIRVLDGRMELTVGPSVEELERSILESGGVYRIRPGTLHRMIGLSDCRLLEVSTPELDDVVRLEDRYGREGTREP